MHRSVKTMTYGYLDKGFASVRGMVMTFNDAWVAAWAPGLHLTVDESMVLWTGHGNVHHTFIRRKPTPLGIGEKTMCCAASGVLLQVEIMESKEDSSSKKFVAEYGATTACTLRLVEPYFRTGRVVVGDSWFGSYKTVCVLRERGLYAIVCVKTATK